MGATRLTAPGLEDVPALVEGWSEPETQAAFGRRPGMSEDEAERHVEHAQGLRRFASWQLAIREEDSPELIGWIELHPQDEGGVVEYWVRRPWRGRGHATRAVRRLTDHAFQETGWPWIEADIHSANEGSRRVAMGAGFRETAMTRERWQDRTMVAVWRRHAQS